MGRIRQQTAIRKFCFVKALVSVLICAPASAGEIHDAAKSGDVERLSTTIDAGADVDSNDGHATPLYYAVTKRHLKAVELLLGRGANVNGETHWGAPITSAAWNGDVAMLKLLLGHGANPNVSYRTETPLHLASQQGCLACVELLVSAGADINALTKFREPPIHFAVKAGHRDLADFFVRMGYTSPKVPSISSKLKRGNVERGERLFSKECKRCHDASPAKHKFRGPTLWNIVARPVASIAGVNYSNAMRLRGGSWSYENLNEYLSDPTRVIPGSDMGSNGLQNENDRIDLISFLRTRAEMPQPLP
jgi:cytochrome c